MVREPMDEPHKVASRSSHEIRLAELPALAASMRERIRSSRFEPEIIVYVETGARLFAHELAGLMGVPKAPIWVKRGGHGLKKWLAPVAVRLPVAVRDGLRWLEERSGVQRFTRRTAVIPGSLQLAGRRILLVDDAADTGRTLIAARKLLHEGGVASENLRSAVIAATMPEARAVADFYLLDRNHRMPWSADSTERSEAERRASCLSTSDAPRDF